MKHRTSLTFRFFILFISAVLLPTILLGSLSIVYFKEKIVEEINLSNSKAANLLVTNIEYYMSNLEKLTLAPYTNIDLLNTIKQINNNIDNNQSEYNQVAFNELTYIIPKTFMNMDKEIVGFTIAINDSLMIVCEKYKTLEVVDLKTTRDIKWHSNIIDEKKHIDYYGLNKADYYSGPTKEVFSVTRIIKDYNANSVLGVIKADADASYIKNMMKDIGYSEDTIVAITSGEGDIIYTTHPQVNLTRYMNDSGILIENGKDEYIIGMNESKAIGWNIYILSPVSQINDKLSGIYKIILFITMGCVAVAIIIYVLMIKSTTKPLRKIIKGIDKMEKKDFNYRIDVKSNLIEIQILQDSLNNMQDKLKEYIDREYRAVLSRKNAEYLALQAQINPHFLYNTLGGFITLNRLGERDLLQKGILALTGMMRYIVEMSDTSTIEDEVKLLNQYCELSKMRFDERLDYYIEMERDVRNVQIPKLILQPIVENAIIHGLEPSNKVCRIDILISNIKNPYKNGKDYIAMIVKDTGVGFDLNTDFLKSGEGLSNIKERVGLYFEESLFHVESEVGQGTIVTIIVSNGGTKGAQIHYSRR